MVFRKSRDSFHRRSEFPAPLFFLRAWPFSFFSSDWESQHHSDFFPPRLIRAIPQKKTPGREGGRMHSIPSLRNNVPSSPGFILAARKWLCR
jgi:hypothetical protein